MAADNTAIRRTAPSAHRIGRAQITRPGPLPERLRKIAPELAEWDQRTNRAFDQIEEKLNEMEAALRALQA